LEYDTNTNTITRLFPIEWGNSELFIGDLAFSPDESMLYVTAYHFGNTGVFFAINLANGVIEDLHPFIGIRSQMAVTSCGSFIYLTDPVGCIGESVCNEAFFPTNSVYRYDVKNKSMEIYLDGTDLGFNYFPTTYVFLSPDNDNKYLYLFTRSIKINDMWVRILKIDRATREIVDFFPSPHDWGALIWDAKLSRYIPQTNYYPKIKEIKL